LEEVPGQVHRNKTRTAAHSGKIKALDVTPHLVLVDNHGGKRRCRGEKTAVNNENVDVLRLEPCLLEKVVKAGENDKAGLFAGSFHGGVRWDVVDGGGKTGLLSKPGPLENPHLKLHALLVVDDEPGVLHERGKGHAASEGRLEARVVDEVDGSRPGGVAEGG